MKRKVCVVITARPSYSRIKTALRAIDDHPNLELQLVVAGSAVLDRYGNASKIIQKDGFVIKEKIFNILEGESTSSMAKTTGMAILELATCFSNLKPDIVVTVADRFETLATSIASSFQNIPLAHIQGGEVSGNIDEKVRHANTKLSDIHLVSNMDARIRVIKMGEDPNTVFNTGCPSIDIVKEILKSPNLNFNPVDKYGGVGSIFNWEAGYLVVLQHPVTTEINKTESNIKATLEVINELQIPTFWFWPNVDAGSDELSKNIRSFRENQKPSNILFFKNMEPEDFLRLLINSKCLIGNSSVGIREGSYLGIPVVNIGSRQNGRQRGVGVIDCGHSKKEIKSSIKKQLKVGRYDQESIYGDGNAGKKIAQVLATCQLKFNKKIIY